MKKSLYFIIVFVGLVGCKNVYYTLSGSAASGTIQVVNFNNLSGGGPPYLAQKLTEDLKTYYLQNSRLRIANSEADYIVEGDILEYQVVPLAPGADQQAAQTRINISVKVRFTDNKNPDNNFEQNFTNYADFPQTTTLAQVEAQKIQEIFDKIIFDIFQKTVANW
ncbi:MAG: LptE family protein [Raineya sp.]|nr:LptE family protein [Raineya sp.]